MNDTQPKPRKEDAASPTGERHLMQPVTNCGRCRDTGFVNGKPCPDCKPTGEWTEEKVSALFQSDFVPHTGETGWQRIANAINAVLDAERLKLAAACKVSQDSQKALWEATKQLAAEREKFQKAKEWNRIIEIEVNNLRSLLNEIDPDISRKIIAELRQQLDGEREKVKSLTEQMQRDFKRQLQ